MKKILSLFLCAAILLSLAACSIGISARENYFGFSKKDFILIEESDTHGGFHGDGWYRLILDCSENREQTLKNVRSWEPLPLSENLDLILYGGEKDGVTYSYHLAEKAKIPKIRNGYYRFCDRHSESTDSSDDSELFDRSSFNFSLAVYDSDTDRLYYFEFDT